MLYDTHYLALQQSLRPITKAFLLALLPGLEEENGEFFDQVGFPFIPIATRNLMLLGSSPPRSTISNRNPAILPTESMALHAHHTIRTSTSTPLSRTTAPKAHWRRRYDSPLRRLTLPHDFIQTSPP